MTICDQQAHLQRAFDAAQAKLAAMGGAAAGFDHPARKAWIQEMRRLERLGFEFPKHGLCVVAAFADEPRNKIQALGRAIYYRNPSRYHVLLPYLGAVMPSRPGHAGPGPWKPPEARR